MFFDAKKISEMAAKKPRDARGRFFSKTNPPQNAAETTFKTSSPLGNFSKRPDPSFEEPLISFSIRNPFKKILYWLNDIRKKQTTTFDLKIKIPLIALPVFLIVLGGAFQAFFNLGQYAQKQETLTQPTPTPIVITQPTKPPEPILVSKVGIIKATYQVKNLLSPTPTSTSSAPTVFPTPTSIPSRYVLVVRSDQIIFLLTSSEISLNYYLNQRVLTTGLYDKIANTLKISKQTDIEILP